MHREGQFPHSSGCGSEHVRQSGEGFAAWLAFRAVGENQ